MNLKQDLLLNVLEMYQNTLIDALLGNKNAVV